jgi:nitrite reductase/ring-hydroxylating ferredoxin subunit
MPEGPTRRAVLAGICGTAALAGCSSSSEEPAAPAPPRGAGGPIAKVADIPVGGGKVVSAGGQSVLIVQPTAGQIMAFSANCTHQGTIIGDPVDGVSTCPNHGSRFKAADGSVLNGPAGTPLGAVNVTVTGDDITLA